MKAFPRFLLFALGSLLLAGTAQAQFQLKSGTFNSLRKAGAPIDSGSTTTTPQFAGRGATAGAIADSADFYDRYPASKQLEGVTVTGGIVLVRASAGTVFASGVPRYGLGDEILPPATGIGTIGEVPSTYWRGKPVIQGEQVTQPGLATPLDPTPLPAAPPYSYYYSPHAKKVFAHQAGRVSVLWVTQQPVYANGTTTTPVTTAITGATNETPIQIESVKHGLADGDFVTISGVTGNDAANGQWAVTTIDDDTFTIPVSGNGIYSAGGDVSAEARFRFRRETFSVSTGTTRPVRTIYWTERTFNGPKVTIPTGRIVTVNPAYNQFFPQTVAEEYEAVGQVPADPNASPPPELRTLWFENNAGLGQLRAYNREGRVFVEYLGTLQGGTVHEFLGADVVEISQSARSTTTSVKLGEQILPHDVTGKVPENADVLLPSTVLNLSQGGTTFYGTSARPDGRLIYHAEWENQDPDRVTFYWLEESDAAIHYLTAPEVPGLGIAWPKYLNKYRQVWPQALAEYEGVTVEDAGSTAATGIQFSGGTLPTLIHQDDPGQTEAQIDVTTQRLLVDFGASTDKTNRSLLKFSTGSNLWYVRLFIQSQTQLGAPEVPDNPATPGINEFVSAVYTLADRNADGVRDVSLAAGVTSTQAVVGQRIQRPDDSYELAGYIAAGDSYHPEAYQNPFQEGVTAAGAGAIIPVNAIPGYNNFTIWWFKKVQPPAAGFDAFYVPSVSGRYTVSWLTTSEPSGPDQDQIIMASNSGSGDLSPAQAAGTIYFQNDAGQPGYNPNEEHALMLGGRAYALRDDLNVTSATGYTSAPFVLISYVDPADSRPAVRVFEVQREIDQNSDGLNDTGDVLFDYSVTAGAQIPAPMPLPLLPLPLDANGNVPNREVAVAPDAAPSNTAPGHYADFTTMDRKGYTWVYRGPHSPAPTGKIVRLTVTNGGSGYTSAPTVAITGGGGSGATATANLGGGGVNAITVSNGGTDYTSAPTVTLTAGGGTGAAATASLNATFTGIKVTTPGTGYSAPPTVSISGGGGAGATATANISAGAVTSITLTSRGAGYTSAPTITLLGGGGSGATAVADATGIVGVKVTGGGTGYTTAPAVTLSGGGGTGAVATAVRNQKITSIAVNISGAGYTTAPTVTISGGGGSGATATAVLSGTTVASITLNNPGSGYTSPPDVTITGGGGSGAIASAVTTGTVGSVVVTSPGSGYTSAPTVSFSGGGGTGAVALAKNTGIVNAIVVTNPGSGYTSAPTVAITGGGGTNAAATASVSGADAVSSITLVTSGSGAGATAATAKAELSIDPSLGMQFYYTMREGFFVPGVTPQPAVGTVLPYLRPSTEGVPQGNAVTGPPLTVVYRPVWPDAAPELRVAETLTLAKFGLPQVRGQSSAEVFYQQSIAIDGASATSVTLHDPTRTKTVSLSEIPGSIATTLSNGRTYFQRLPPHLQERVYFQNGELVFAGEFVDEPAGEDYLNLNVLSTDDVDALKGLTGTPNPTWNTTIDGLVTAVETFVENPAKLGTYKVGSTVNVNGTSLATISDSDTAVDSYALTATGKGTGYVSVLFGDGEAFTPEGDPVSFGIMKVAPRLYVGDMKVQLSNNPLDEQVTLRHSGDFAAKPDDYEFEWRYAPLVDGLPPATYAYNAPAAVLDNASTWRLVQNPAAKRPTASEYAAGTSVGLPRTLTIHDAAHGGGSLPGIVMKSETAVDFSGGLPAQVILSADLSSDLDGFVLYVNGNEALAFNAPAPFVNRNSSSDLSTTGLNQQFEVSPNYFAKGPNVLEVALYSSADRLANSQVNFRLETVNRNDRVDPAVFAGSPWLQPNGTLKNIITLGGSPTAPLGDPVLLLQDNAFTVRYRPKVNTGHVLATGTSQSAVPWSDWMDAKSVSGWVKRVLDAINPYNQRMTDLFNNAVNTDVSVITQAGTRWEGDIALNLENVNDAGLIEIYETVLNRAKSFSIDNGYDVPGVNDALLLAAGYLNDLYIILGNEAYADAANPTISLDDQDTITEVNTSRFSFEGQVVSSLDEELALLRGRDDFLATSVSTAPAYNRLYWNYTNGIESGEVLYAVNYNIKEKVGSSTEDGIIDVPPSSWRCLRSLPDGLERLLPVADESELHLDAAQ